MKAKVVSFLNINFFDVGYNYVIRSMKERGGYAVFPAASALVKTTKNIKYKVALQKSTLALFDSGYFTILLRIFKFVSIKKFSGYKFMSSFLNDNTLKKKKILLLDPSKNSSNLNYSFLRLKKFKFIKSYVCPIYSVKNIVDKNLLNIINYYKPEIVISNIGGEIQEILALYIKENYKKKIQIFCTGAALAFFTGEQARIGYLYDRFYLGWFKRLLFNPKQYSVRILASIYLVIIVLKAKINTSYN